MAIKEQVLVGGVTVLRARACPSCWATRWLSSLAAARCCRRCCPCEWLPGRVAPGDPSAADARSHPWAAGRASHPSTPTWPEASESAKDPGRASTWVDEPVWGPFCCPLCPQLQEWAELRRRLPELLSHSPLCSPSHSVSQTALAGNPPPPSCTEDVVQKNFCSY